MVGIPNKVPARVGPRWYLRFHPATLDVEPVYFDVREEYPPELRFKGRLPPGVIGPFKSREAALDWFKAASAEMQAQPGKPISDRAARRRLLDVAQKKGGWKAFTRSEA